MLRSKFMPEYIFLKFLTFMSKTNFIGSGNQKYYK